MFQFVGYWQFLKIWWSQRKFSFSILSPLLVLPGARAMLSVVHRPISFLPKLSPPFVTDRSQPVIIKGVSGRVGSESATAAAGGGGEEVDNTWCYTCRHSQPAPSSKSPLLHHSHPSFAPSNFKPGLFPFFSKRSPPIPLQVLSSVPQRVTHRSPQTSVFNNAQLIPFPHSSNHGWGRTSTKLLKAKSDKRPWPGNDPTKTGWPYSFPVGYFFSSKWRSDFQASPTLGHGDYHSSCQPLLLGLFQDQVQENVSNCEFL